MRPGVLMLGFLGLALRLLVALGADLVREARDEDLQRAADDLARALL